MKSKARSRVVGTLPPPQAISMPRRLIKKDVSYHLQIARAATAVRETDEQSKAKDESAGKSILPASTGDGAFGV